MKSILSVLAIIIVAGAIFWFVQSRNGIPAAEAPANPAGIQEEGSGLEDGPAGVGNEESVGETETVTLAEVAQHATEDDCWIAIEGKVYDVTEFIPQHPGGQFILNGCGKDATAMFNNRPGSGTAHSDQARANLPNFYVADLAQ